MDATDWSGRADGNPPAPRRGPIAGGSVRRLDAVMAESVPAGQPSASRTGADVEAKLGSLGWGLITRAKVARLRAAGYHLGVSRAARPLQHAVDTHDVTWRADFTGCGLEAFATPSTRRALGPS